MNLIMEMKYYWLANTNSPPLSVLFPTIGIRAGPLEEDWSREGRSIIMNNKKREGFIRTPIFNGSNFVFWKVRTTTYLQSLGTDVWEIMEGGYTYPSAIPTDTAKRKQYELNAKAITVLLGSLS